jgi:hypothetical protein
LGWGGLLASASASGVVACAIVAPLDGLSGGNAGGRDAGEADASAVTVSLGEGGDDGDDLGPNATDDAVGDDTSQPVAPPDAAQDAGGADACVPTPLACDGKAHACDGVIDEGCPSALKIGGPGAPQVLGGNASGGTPFNDPCPAGQVLVGLGGATGQWIDAVYGICGAVALKAATTSAPYTYGVAISAGQTLPTRGTVGSSDAMWRATCPPDQAVVSVAGNSGTAMDQVVLSCAPLRITGSPGSFAIHQGNATALAPQGDTSGGSPFTPVACPDPQVVGLVGGSSGQWLDSMSIACVMPAIALVR